MNDSVHAAPVLVFCHIEKSAGTSFRSLLWRNYGRENVFWYGIDLPFSDKLRPAELLGYRVIGGHFDLSVFDNAPFPMLQVAFVRDPVDRAASLFRYYTKGSKQENRQQWIEWGIDPESLRRSIENCRPFRRAVNNMQCRRISGRRKSGDALAHVQSYPFLLSTHERIGESIEELASALNWRFKDLGQENVAGEPYRDELLSESGVREMLEELNAEDRILYEAAGRNRPAGSLDRFADLQDGLASGHPKRQSYFGNEDLARMTLSVSIPGENAERTGTKRITFRIENRSARMLRAGGAHQIMLGVHWDSPDGERVVHEGGRYRLPETVLPNASLEFNAPMRIPKGLEPGRYDLVVSLVQQSVTWLDQLQDGHVARLSLIVR